MEIWNINFKSAFTQGYMKKSKQAFSRIERNGTRV